MERSVIACDRLKTKVIPAAKTHRTMRATSFRLVVRQRWWTEGGADRKEGRRSGLRPSDGRQAGNRCRPVERRGGAGPCPLIEALKVIRSTDRGLEPHQLRRAQKPVEGASPAPWRLPGAPFRAPSSGGGGAEGKGRRAMPAPLQTTGRRSVGFLTSASAQALQRILLLVTKSGTACSHSLPLNSVPFMRRNRLWVGELGG